MSELDEDADGFLQPQVLYVSSEFEIIAWLHISATKREHHDKHVCSGSFAHLSPNLVYPSSEAYM